MTSAEPDQLTGWEAELARMVQEVRLELEPLTDAQFAWRPGPGRWSIGECLNHLAITTGLVVGKLATALERARAEPRLGQQPFKLGMIGGWFARTMERPGKRAMPSPTNFVPPSDLPKAHVLAAFYESQERLRETLTAARGLALDRIKAPSAAEGAGWLRLSTAAWFASTLAHGRRHLNQARRVRESAGFPG